MITMAWEVSSNIYGGIRYSPATFEEYRALAGALDERATELSALASAWASAGLQIRSRQTAALCPMLTGGDLPRNADLTNIRHSTLPLDQLRDICDRQAADCTRVAERVCTLARLLIRAHALYAEAETRSRETLDATIQGSMTLLPMHTSAALGIWALAGAFTKGGTSRGPSGIGGLSATSWAHQGVARALARAADPIGPLIAGRQTVAAGAERLTPLTKRLADTDQGDILTVTHIPARTPVVTAVHGMNEALSNLQRLGSQRRDDQASSDSSSPNSASGLDYATIAIQRYRKSDGANAWLVTIPGTDGQPDSPFGWLQNVEAMSADPDQRRQADSVRLVREAMDRSGIAVDDEVVLVGHSQGGIVAAAIASDEQERYSIAHVLTAGSPIANHPIPEHTWVTSIEMEDELVAELDGSSNPQTEGWLTIRGAVHEQDGMSIPATPFEASPVTDVGDDRRISHGLQFHQAAYRNAEGLGSPAVQRHERHFEDVLEGTLVETSYWQGRMSQRTSGGE